MLRRTRPSDRAVARNQTVLQKIDPTMAGELDTILNGIPVCPTAPLVPIAADEETNCCMVCLVQRIGVTVRSAPRVRRRGRPRPSVQTPIFVFQLLPATKGTQGNDVVSHLQRSRFPFCVSRAPAATNRIQMATWTSRERLKPHSNIPWG